MTADLPGPEPVYAFWCRHPSRPNFGDALTPWLIRKIAFVYPTFARPEEPVCKFLVTGSIVSYATASCIVWGAGVLSAHDAVSPRARFLAVRGPLTRRRALACGADCAEVYGDPALLLPRFYSPAPGARRGVGVVPHFSDRPRVAAKWRDSPELELIDIQGPVESVVDRLAGCELVVSSSLHGLIAAHAYGVPAVWVKYRDLPCGDDSKFYDYFLSIDRDPSPVKLKEDEHDPDRLAAHAVAPPREFSLQRLWDACPFRSTP